MWWGEGLDFSVSLFWGKNFRCMGKNFRGEAQSIGFVYVTLYHHSNHHFFHFGHSSSNWNMLVVHICQNTYKTCNDQTRASASPSLLNILLCVENLQIPVLTHHEIYNRFRQMMLTELCSGRFKLILPMSLALGGFEGPILRAPLVPVPSPSLLSMEILS